MRLIKRIIEIVCKKDVEWIEIFLACLALVFVVVLVPPGDYFADRPRLRGLEQPVHGLILRKSFWLSIFGGVGLVQWLAIAAGEVPVVVRITRTWIIGFSAYAIRMRVLALTTGLWSCLIVLGSRTAEHWHGMPISIAVGLFVVATVFSLIGALRMAAHINRTRDQHRWMEICEEAERLYMLRLEVEQMHREDRIAARTAS